MKIDPIRGARYGLMNTKPMSSSAVFSRTSYGQFRDMFEQSLDTPKGTIGEDFMANPITGGPVTYFSRNPNDPRLEVDPVDNNRRNKDRYQRCRYPFIEPDGMGYDDNNEFQFGNPNYPTWEIQTDPESLGPISAGVPLGAVGSVTTLTVNLPGQINTARTVSPGSIRPSNNSGS